MNRHFSAVYRRLGGTFPRPLVEVSAAVVYILLPVWSKQPCVQTPSEDGVAPSSAIANVSTSTVDDATTCTYVERRLEAIPRIGIFHVGGDWAINWSRSQEGTANVIIENHVQPLPFFGILAGLASEMGDDGTIVQRVDVYCSPIPDWVGKQGYSPSSWIGAWQ